MSRRSVEVFADAEAAALALAAEVAGRAGAAIAARGRFTWALAGGSTPRGVYRRLAADEERLDWGRIHLFWGDERMVPPDDPASNFGEASRLLLSRVPLPPANAHRVRGEALSATRAAEDYEAELRRFFATPAGRTPRLDLIMLGMGADGHTASLFPGRPELEVRDRLAVSADPPGPDAEAGPARVTLTLPVLEQAECVLFLVTGEGKRDTLARVLEEKPSSELPASLVRPRDGELRWIIDRAAAPPTLAGGDPTPGR